MPDAFLLMQMCFRNLVQYSIGHQGDFYGDANMWNLAFPDPGLILRSVKDLDFAKFDSWGVELVIWPTGSIPIYHETIVPIDSPLISVPYDVALGENVDVYIYGIAYLLSNNGLDSPGPLARYVATYPVRGNYATQAF